MAEAQYTQAEIDAMIAKMKAEKKTTPASRAAAVVGGKGTSARGVNVGAVLNAAVGSDYGQSLSDDKGKYDGTYEITITGNEIKNTKKGDIFKTFMTIDASSNPAVAEGSAREHPVWQNNDAGLGETKKLWLKFAEAKGEELSEEFAATIFGEEQCMAGSRWELRVFTEPQKKDRSKTFTHHRYTALD